MKIDPHMNKESYLRWKAKTAAGIPGVSQEDSVLIRRYLQDMESGRNIARGTKKGPRSYIHINTTKNRIVLIAKKLKLLGTLSLAETTEDEAHALFSGMRSGEIPKKDGAAYRSTYDYVKVFRAFWHWHMKVTFPH